MKKIIFILITSIFILTSCGNDNFTETEYKKQLSLIEEKYYSKIKENPNFQINWEEYCLDHEKITKYSEEFISEETYRNIINFSFSEKIGNCIFSSQTTSYIKKGIESPIEKIMTNYKIEELGGDVLFTKTCFNQENQDECNTFSEYQKIKFNELTK